MLIPGFPNYDMSAEFPHNITNVITNKRIKLSKNWDGYLMVGLWNNGKCDRQQHAVWIARCFIPNLENKRYVDHVNRNFLDNSIENLRWADGYEQSMNRTLQPSASGHVGISWHPAAKKWQVRITSRGNRIDVGRYDTIEDAVEALRVAKLNTF
jgi:hypothetical protein